ncbi:MAG TPA: hypothetical protein DGT21_04855 [Armatimonadetes bacterium]|jgi:hypothetical protein|nr:hypothetical protein [Armatimonadota bacterium]
MNRLLVPLAITLLAVPALAGPQWVSLDHWAYDAMQRLVDLGVATGFPDGIFGGNRLLTRYEFAAAVARTLDALAARSGNPGPAGAEGELHREEIAAILARLEAEFKAEIAELRGELDYGTHGDNDLLARVTHLEEAMEGPKVITSLEHRIGLPGHLDAEYDAYLTAATGIPHQLTDHASVGPR